MKQYYVVTKQGMASGSGIIVPWSREKLWQAWSALSTTEELRTAIGRPGDMDGDFPLQRMLRRAAVGAI